ncbi:ABC transporter [Coccidioides posadasii str. Silveira]|uniref:ABC transporter n=1 Tax=Coccidioides posadasii (strain RMSCC 757 / Silveira) TaxID=443226 RepID=E9DCF5_COCPS|nr:ABC transporter [Coccidioides posadasii str. Silveira]
MPEGEGGVCYKEPLVVKENYQICDVTNRKILDQLKEKKPQVTFSCTAKDHTCNFQFWVDQKESFYCSLDTCEWATEVEYGKNTTNYECEHIKCRCIPGRMLCGEDGSIDIGEFLEQDIKGPASFSTISTQGGSDQDGSTFQEPAMNNLIKSVFGDKSIFLQCRAGECLYKTDVPGYKVPVKTINTPLIAGVIAGCGLFIVAVILFIWYLSRRSAYRNYAAIQLSDDSDDENGKLMADHKPAALQFDNVSYYLNGRQILSGIRGIARPGQVTAIMGASGAGKTTFLDILARKNKRGTVQGEFYVNGEKVDDSEYRSVVGFVDQEDTMLPTLTVHETILTSALLRLPKDMSNVVKEQRVFEVEKQLGIYHIKDQIIGSEGGKGRGISGGEKKRVSIACELVTSPSILFLDEPTSGLPRSNIVALFDQLILLAKGKTVYSGSFMGCQPYFDHIGYTCPLGFNIADYLVDLTMHAGTTRSPEEPLLNADAQADHFRTPSSSLRAVKSVASASNASFENSTTESAQDSTAPRKHIRRQSLRQRQERQLYTRKKTSGVDSPSTPRTDDEDNAMGSLNDSTQQWLRLSRQQNSAPSQTVEDPDHLPPIASGYITDLDVIISSYASSDVAASIRDEIASAVESARQANGSADPTAQQGSGGVHMVGYTRVSLLRQFIILSKRTWKNLYRNPMLMLTHYAIAILLAVLSGYLFYGLTDDIKGFQNRLGLFFFLLALFGFSTLTSLTVFTSERLLFMRERANGYYSPITYFAAKVVFDIIPLRLIPPIIMGVIVYPMLSIFHYGFEALIVNEVTYLTLIDHKYGLDIEVPGASILSAFGFDTLALWRDVTGLAVFSGVFIILAYGAMHFLLVERR